MNLVCFNGIATIAKQESYVSMATREHIYGTKSDDLMEQIKISFIGSVGEEKASNIKKKPFE